VLRAAEAWLDASTWPGHGLHVGRAEDEQGTQQTLRLVELFQRSSGHMFSMCSEERYSECPGGLWRPGIGFSALLASYRGRAGMSSAQGRLKMRFSGRTKKFRVWPPCRHNTSASSVEHGLPPLSRNRFLTKGIERPFLSGLSRVLSGNIAVWAVEVRLGTTVTSFRSPHRKLSTLGEYMA
jgi:hypothetical protein